ncbi:Potassium voltage-gated channel subfamily H member 4, partial [Takifugu flavidus]
KMPVMKGLLAPQNTFLDTIATRFDGTRKFSFNYSEALELDGTNQLLWQDTIETNGGEVLSSQLCVLFDVIQGLGKRVKP